MRAASFGSAPPQSGHIQSSKKYDGFEEERYGDSVAPQTFTLEIFKL